MSDFLAFANRIKHFYVRQFAQVAEESGLSQLEIDILLFLYNHSSCNTAKDIVQLRGVAKSNVSTCIDALVRKGLLEVLPDEKSRRVRRLCLTEDAKTKAAQLALVQAETFRILFEDVSAEEKEVFEGVLRKLDEKIQLSGIKE